MSTCTFEVTEVAQSSRLKFLPKHAGNFFMTFEAMVFNYLFFVDDKRKRAAGLEAQQISKQQQYLTDAFYALRDYAHTLPEANLINRLID